MPSVHVDVSPRGEVATDLLRLAIAEAVATHVPCQREEVEVSFGPPTEKESRSSGAYLTIHLEEPQGPPENWYNYRREHALPSIPTVDGWLGSLLVSDEKEPNKHYVVNLWSSRDAFRNHVFGPLEVRLKELSERNLSGAAKEVLVGPVVRLLDV